MDCQFLMMAITYVHYATFVATPDHSLPVGSVINARRLTRSLAPPWSLARSLPPYLLSHATRRLPVSGGGAAQALKHMSDADKHQVLDAAKASLGLT